MAAIEATDLHEGPTAPVWRLLGDEALARAAGRGNDHAFAALYARYSQPLRGYCASILLNSEDAEDAVQATMLKAMRALPARRPGLPIRPWLYRIAHNEAIDTLRRRRFHRDVEEEISPALIAPGPEVDLARRERLAELVRDLRTLPDRQRAALLMRELSGLGYDEIAGALDVTPGAVRQLVFEARTTMHECERGRDTACATVQRSLSDADRRRWRARTVRAHLRSCNACRAFEMAIGRREEDLAALPPLIFEGTAAIAVAAGGVLGLGLVGGSSVASLVSGTAAKGIATAALAIAVGTGAAMETGVAPIGAGEPTLRESTRAEAPAPVRDTVPKGAPSVRREAARATETQSVRRRRAVRTTATVDPRATVVHVPRVHVELPAAVGVGSEPVAVSRPKAEPQPAAPRPAAAPPPTAQAVSDWTRERATQIAQQTAQRATEAAQAAMAEQQTLIQRTLDSTRQTLTTIQQQTTQSLSRVRELVARLLQPR